jgi:hypothetical protein
VTAASSDGTSHPTTGGDDFLSTVTAEVVNVGDCRRHCNTLCHGGDQAGHQRGTATGGGTRAYYT